MTAVALDATRSVVVWLRSHGRRRELTVVAVLAVALLAVAAATLAAGDYPMSPARVWQALWGGGEALDRTIVWDQRMPRLVLAAVAGAGLGLAGALMQTLLRNPLASPDIMGISGGASVGAVAASTMGLTGGAVALSAFGGAAVVGAILLALSGGRAGGYRIVVTGVGLAFVAAALVGFVLKRAQINSAQSALIWTIGSVNAATWAQAGIVALVVACALIPSTLLARHLPVDQLGDVARSLGLFPGGVRVATLATTTLLAAGVVAFTGPVGFVALAAAPIARGLVGRGRLALGPAAITGALLLAAADFAAARVDLPVGVITGIAGAPYLLWLLARRVR